MVFCGHLMTLTNGSRLLTPFGAQIHPGGGDGTMILYKYSFGLQTT